MNVWPTLSGSDLLSHCWHCWDITTFSQFGSTYFVYICQHWAVYCH